MEKRLMEILEVKHLISLMVTITILGIIIYLVLSNRDMDLVVQALTILTNAFNIVLGYLFGRQKHLDVNSNKSETF